MSQMLSAALTVDIPNASHEILDNFEGRTGKFIKGFLLNDKRNKNGWKVDWESIKKYASDWINHPGIYYVTYGEPDHTDGETYRENMSNQESYRVVNIVSVIPDELTHTLNYVGEIIDAEFEQEWNAGNINMTSPGIWPEEMETVGKMENGRPKLDVTKHRALHVAYINEPAYGSDAYTIATCDGDGEACRIRLSAKTDDGVCMGLCAQNDLAPLQEVPLIRKTLNNQFTKCEVDKMHGEFVALAGADNCVANKLQIIMEDNPDMAKDQQLAIAYSYCQQTGIEELYADVEGGEDIEWITVSGNPIPIKPGESKDDVVKDFIDKQKDSTPSKEKKEPKQKKDVFDTKSYNDDDGRIKISVNKIDGVPDYEGRVKQVRDIWNDIPAEDKKGIKKFLIGKPNSTTKRAAGTFNTATDTVGIHLNNISVFPGETESDIKSKINGIMIHEISHSKFAKLSPITKGNWSNDVMKVPPITEYLKKFRKQVIIARSELKFQKTVRDHQWEEEARLEKTIKNNTTTPEEKQKATDDLDWLQLRMKRNAEDYTTAYVTNKITVEAYGNETHSEFSTLNKGFKPLWESDPAAFEKIKPIYEKHFGAKR